MQKNRLWLVPLMACLMFSFVSTDSAYADGVSLQMTTIRRNFLRMEDAAYIGLEIANETGSALRGAQLKIYMDGRHADSVSLPEIAPGAKHELRQYIDSSLREGEYEFKAVVEAARAGGELVVPVVIVQREVPVRMPVVGWFARGMNYMEELKDIGFTHTLQAWQAGISNSRVLEAGAPVPEASEEVKRSIDEALAWRMKIAPAVPPASINVRDGKYSRIDREGNPVDRYNVCGNFEEIREYSYNVGASIAQVYHEYPAWESAMIHTEIRDNTAACFHEHDYELFREYAGIDIPEEIESVQFGSGLASRGLFRHNPHYYRERLPRNRIIPDDHPILTYYRWFWKKGDGWNELHSQVHRGLKSTGREDVWTWFDPAVRVPSLWGSGGDVSIISHWSYGYPNPEKLGQVTDQLFAMLKGASNPDQEVMKMTQFIWHRYQAAGDPRDDYQAQWEKDIPPGMQYLTIAPDVMSIALWAKISRPIKGIMYHGLGCLLPVDYETSYRYTNSDTKHVLRDLVKTIIDPLGPTLMQVPDIKSDVAFLESFTSQMFAGRGASGWGWGWGGDAYLMLRYAQIQPEVVYEETLLEYGLDGYSVLVMPECDVLTESVAEIIEDFQLMGGIVVGDENLAPGIMADITMSSHAQRRSEGDAARQILVDRSEWLRENLDPYIHRASDTDNPDVLTRVRRYGDADYLFAYNDRREFGNYVGHHGRVMEDGVPASAVVMLRRDSGHVYDLLDSVKVPAVSEGGWLKIEQEFGGAEGRLWMVTGRPVSDVVIEAPSRARAGERVDIVITIADDLGDPMDAVVPVAVDILDPRGSAVEFSGYYGAKDGRIEITFDVAPNDEAGAWTVRARELASGITEDRQLVIN